MSTNSLLSLPSVARSNTRRNHASNQRAAQLQQQLGSEGADSGAELQFISALNSIVARGGGAASMARRASIDSRLSVTLDAGAEDDSMRARTQSIPSTMAPSVGRVALSVSLVDMDEAIAGAANNKRKRDSTVIVGSTTPPALAPTLALDNGATTVGQTIIDCSDVFPETVGKRAGLFVFRIENLRPEALSIDQLGRFCVADCYIVLSSTSTADDQDLGSDDVEHDDFDDAYLTHRVFTWIGSHSELDKRFCCAMYAVGLRNLVHSPDKVERVTDTEEPEGFSELFAGSLEHTDASFATATSLFAHAPTSLGPLRMYRLEIKSTGVHMRLVAPSRRGLDSNAVFVVLGNVSEAPVVWCWVGANVGVAVRAKGRIVCEAIWWGERMGRGRVQEIEEGDEDEAFWVELDAARPVRSRTRQLPWRKPLQGNGDADDDNDELDDEESDDDDDTGGDFDAMSDDQESEEDAMHFQALAARPARLYRAPDVSDDYDYDYEPSVASPTDANAAVAVPEDLTDPARNLVHVDPAATVTDRGGGGGSGAGRLSRGMLRPDGCYVLDVGVEVYLSKESSLFLISWYIPPVVALFNARIRS